MGCAASARCTLALVEVACEVLVVMEEEVVCVEEGVGKEACEQEGGGVVEGGED